MDMNVNAWFALESAAREDQQHRALSWQIVRRIASFTQHRQKILLRLLAFSTASAVLAIATPVLAGWIVDAIFEKKSTDMVISLASVIAIISIAEAGVSLGERWQLSKMGEGLILDLRRAVFEHVQRMPIAFFTRTRTDALVSRLNNDVLAAQRAFSMTLSGVVGNTIALLLTFVVMVVLSWQVTLLALILLPIFVLPARRMGKRLAGMEREAADHNCAVTTQMAERFCAPGATLVKLFGRPVQEAAEFGAGAIRVHDIAVRSAVARWIFITALTLVSALALALVYGLGGYFAVQGSLNPGTVVTLALLLTRLYTPLTGLMYARADAMAAIVSFERVFEVLDFTPLIAESAHPRTIPDGPVTVEFENVHFGYPEADKVSLASLEEATTLGVRAGQEVLHGISFRVKPGQLVALVGSSGAGKSTIAALLPRLYDVDRGAVRLSDIDVRDLSFASIQQTLGMVTHDGYLWHASIAQNLRYARPDASDAQLWDALARARLAELVRTLPDQLETVVGECDYQLSEGERQQLTIARLLLAEPRVVIVDEVAAHLDSPSEAAVQEALAEVITGRTALVIAHRLSTIRNADMILVIEDGRIIERGTHAQLYIADRRYAQLYRTQFTDKPTSRLFS